MRGKTFVQGQVRGVKILDVFPGSQRREPACAQIVTVSRALDTSLLVSMVSPYVLRRIWHRLWLELCWRSGAIVPDQGHGQDL